MSNTNMFLYWGSGSAPCWKPMIVLAEKGLWEGLPNKLIEFSKKEHKGEDVLKLNPRGQVPTFKDGDLVVNESGAICMYLEDKYSTDSNKLMPADASARSQVYQRMFETQNIMSNIMLPIIYYKMRTPEAERDASVLEKAKEPAREEVKRWESYLSSSDYLVGSSFTMADVFFYPLLATLVRQGMKLDAYPGLKKYYDTVTSRPSIQATMPPHWKDTPGLSNLADL